MKHSVTAAAVFCLLYAGISPAQTSALVCDRAILTGAAQSAPTTCKELDPLHPFTHEARIPADADLSSIRFSRIKLVSVATEVTLTADAEYCKELAFRDPGGSDFCPGAQLGDFEPAYEVTYSYSGPPLASDEHAGKEFSFSVYFRPTELTDKQLEDLAEGRHKAAGEWFDLTESRQLQRRLVINEAASTFCAGSYIDGNWVHTDPDCHDKVAFKVVAEQSDYVTVRVNVDRPTSADVAVK